MSAICGECGGELDFDGYCSDCALMRIDAIYHDWFDDKITGEEAMTAISGVLPVQPKEARRDG